MPNKIFVIIIAAIIVGSVGVIAITGDSGSNGSVNSEIPASGSFQIDKKKADLGDLPLEEKGVAEFTVTNPSEEPLTISRVRTSCMCTLAEVEIDGQKSPEFNMDMHNTAEVKKWQGTIAPGSQATVRVIYIPKLMPVDGEITRNATFNTSDPDNPEVELAVRAFVLN